MMMSMSPHQNMNMHFHFGYNDIILFDVWIISGTYGLLISVAVCFFMGFTSESLKFGIENLHQYMKRSLIGIKYKKVAPEISDYILDSDKEYQKVKSSQTISCKNH